MSLPGASYGLLSGLLNDAPLAKYWVRSGLMTLQRLLGAFASRATCQDTSCSIFKNVQIFF